jgi:hypothetical protein
MNRRDFLRLVGIGAAAVAIEPARKLWFVGSNAPVGSRVERVNAAIARGDLTFDDHVSHIKEHYESWKRIGSTDLTFATPDENARWFYDETESLKQVRAFEEDFHRAAHSAALRTLAGRVDLACGFASQGLISRDEVFELLTDPKTS